MFLDEKTVLEIWVNPGLNLTIFRGTGPLRTQLQKNSQTIDKLNDIEELRGRMQCHFRFKKADHFPENGANLFKSALNF